MFANFGSGDPLGAVVVMGSRKISPELVEVLPLRGIDTCTREEIQIARFPLDPFYRRILRAYELAPTQVATNGWSQMAGSLYLWFRHSIGFEMPLHVFQKVYLPKKLPKKKDRKEKVDWYYFRPWRVHKPFVLDCPWSIKLWKEMWFWEVAREKAKRLVPRTGGEDEDDEETVPLVKKLKVGDHPKLMLSRLVRGGRTAGEGDKQKRKEIPSDDAAGAINGEEGVAVTTEPLQRTLSITPTRVIVLGDFPSESRRWGKGKEKGRKAFVAGGDIEDLLEASIACSIRAASASMKSLNALKKYKKKMTGEAAKAEEFRATMEGLVATTESAKAAYQKMSEDLAEAKGHIATLTKRLDDTLAPQAIAYIVLEKVNEEKKALQLSSQNEVSALRTDLEAFAKARLDDEEAYVNILSEKRVLKENLVGAEAEFIANFHKTEAYASFSAYFTSIGQQEVITVLHSEFPDLDISILDDKFPAIELGDDVEAFNPPDE
ncbi:hypothetical protein Adt_11392 [Abeliophyllum distichum]|uniref:Uncharacterized protein n=1 Tax=Abeliophyllum distichum TaxID=126358 RepID=A0ABD1UPG0_9LAMI